MKLTRTVVAILLAGSAWAQNAVTLSGRVTNIATGLPIENAIVKLAQGADGYAKTSYTDASGNYSFDDAVAGAGQIDIRAEGFVSFQKMNPGDASIQITADHAAHDFKLTPSATIVCRILGMETDKSGDRMLATLLREDFTDGVRRFAGGGNTELAALATMADVGPDGAFKFVGLEPGRYLVRAGPTRSQYLRIDGSAPLRTPPTEGSVLTYYPGTVEFADALPITLAAGDVRPIEFKLARRSLFRVSGEIELPDGEDDIGHLVINLAGGGIFERTFADLATGPGPFSVGGFFPGHYIAYVLVQGARQPVGLPFTVTDHDVMGLKLVRQSQEELETHGSFRMANGNAPLPGSLSVQFADSLPGRAPDSIPASENGTFWLRAFPGDYSVQPAVPATYAVTEVRYGGASYLNAVIPMKADTLDPSLTIVLTDQPGSVGGSIVDGDQKPVTAKIALAPEPLPAGFDFRAIRVVTNDAQGAFVFSGIAPGRYKAVALTGDDRKRDHDLELLGDKLRVADSFEVVAGQSVSIDIRP